MLFVGSQVAAVEHQLEFQSSEVRYDNITTDDLEVAAKIFIYLKNCPGDDDSRKWFQSWSNFYKDLFKTQTADQIILTLNRMMKTQDGRVMSEKVF